MVHGRSPEWARMGRLATFCDRPTRSIAAADTLPAWTAQVRRTTPLDVRKGMAALKRILDIARERQPSAGSHQQTVATEA